MSDVITNKIDSHQIRAVRCGYNEGLNYWHTVEVKIKNLWFEPYFVNEKEHKTAYILDTFPHEKEIVQNWLSNTLAKINEFLENGWELVDYETYEEYCQQFEYEKTYHDKYTYL